ncbi:MAG: ATP-binding protein DrrA1-3 family domain-containing protein, partial [Promethearchaeota archaeon]
GKTILITTHNMQEAQNICDRILIMNKGKIIADESPDTLRERFKPTSTILFKLDDVLSYDQKKSLSGMFDLKEKTKKYYEFSSSNVLKDISELYKILKDKDIKISDFKIKETSLEEVFIHLIKTDSISVKEGGGLKND